MISLGQVLKNYRTNNALTSQEMADKLNICRSYYSSIEHDKLKKLSPRLIRKIASELNQDIKLIVKLQKGE